MSCTFLLHIKHSSHHILEDLCTSLLHLKHSNPMTSIHLPLSASFSFGRTLDAGHNDLSAASPWRRPSASMTNSRPASSSTQRCSASTEEDATSSPSPRCLKGLAQTVVDAYRAFSKLQPARAEDNVQFSGTVPRLSTESLLLGAEGLDQGRVKAGKQQVR